MTPRRTLPRLVASLLVCLLPTAYAAAPDAAGADDRQAMIAEEKDRLAREQREIREREAQLRKQLEMRKRLAAEQEAYLQQLRQQIRELKGGQ